MNYLAITYPDINNGLGFRVTLWIAGCSHHCKNCQNKHTWNYNQGVPLSEAFKEIEPLLSKPYIKGLTISGGDPLDQSNEDLLELGYLLYLIDKKYPNKDIWLYTGDTLEELLNKNNPCINKILEYVNVLVDGKYDEKLKDRTLAFRGSSNQKIIALK